MPLDLEPLEEAPAKLDLEPLDLEPVDTGERQARIDAARQDIEAKSEHTTAPWLYPALGWANDLLVEPMARLPERAIELPSLILRPWAEAKWKMGLGPMPEHLRQTGGEGQVDQPLITADQIHNAVFGVQRDQGSPLQAAKDWTANFLAGFTSPKMLAAMGPDTVASMLGIELPTAHAMPAAFGVSTAQQVPAVTQNLIAAGQSGDPEAIVRAGLDAASTTAIPILIGKGLLKGPKPTGITPEPDKPIETPLPNGNIAVDPFGGATDLPPNVEPGSRAPGAWEDMLTRLNADQQQTLAGLTPEELAFLQAHAGEIGLRNLTWWIGKARKSVGKPPEPAPEPTPTETTKLPTPPIPPAPAPPSLEDQTAKLEEQRLKNKQEVEAAEEEIKRRQEGEVPETVGEETGPVGGDLPPLSDQGEGDRTPPGATGGAVFETEAPKLDLEPIGEAAPEATERPIPKPGTPESRGAPINARLIGVRYHVNQDILDSGRWKNGKKVTPQERQNLEQEQAGLLEKYRGLTETETGASDVRRPEPRQPGAGAPGMDVRETAGAGEATPPAGETAGAPGGEIPTGPADGGQVEEPRGDERGGGVSGGDGGGTGAATGGDTGRRPGAGAPEGTGADTPKPGLTEEDRTKLRGLFGKAIADGKAVNADSAEELGLTIPEGYTELTDSFGVRTWEPKAEPVVKPPVVAPPEPPPVTEPPPIPPATLPEPTPNGLELEPVKVEDQNHVLPTGEDWIPTGDKAKARANLEAIKLIKRLEAEDRNPTPEEKAKLAQYTGWGGLQAAFDKGKAAYRDKPPWMEHQKREAANWERQWGKLYDEIKSTLTDDEYAAASKSLLNAHYTSRDVINGVWAGARRLGFKGGKALEPSAGIGHFIGLTPEEVRAKTRWTAAELDSISGRILGKLYPDARTHVMGFQDTKIAPNTQDLVISNFPFAKDGPTDKRYPRLNLHNYFFARALDLVKPGGIVAAITSDGTMDRVGSRAAREYFADKADLVGAIRLPNTAFKKNAGTEVTTDILYFRKRDGTPFKGEDFINTVNAKSYKGEPIELNEYFAKHPDMMLGRMSLEGTQYGKGGQALLPTPGAELRNQLAEAVAKLPENVMGAHATPEELAAPVAPKADKGAKVGGLVLKDGAVFHVQADGTLAKPDWAGDKKKAAQAERYIALRDESKGLIAQMLDPNAPEADMDASRARLNKLYDDYVKRHGELNKRASNFLDDDVDYPAVLALEDPETKIVETTRNGQKVVVRETTWSKARIFKERTVPLRRAPERADTVADGLQVSLNYGGRVDPDYIARLTEQDPETVKAELERSGLAFENPDSGQWESRSTYLSGFVKRKLEAAQAAAETDPRYARHVAELTKVQPAPIPAEKIDVRLGSTWVPPSVIDAFIRDVLDIQTEANYTPETGTWSLGGWDAKRYSERNETTYGIHGLKGTDLIQQALNLKSPRVEMPEERVSDTTGEKYTAWVRDPKKSLEAKEKQDQLRREFIKWVKRTPEVAKQLEDIFNANFNGVVAPKFDAPAWAHYPGASEDITLREHQKQVVTRMLQNSTLLAHAVGTGKTYAMITAAMEMRRMGLARKPMIVVQNATLEQFARSFKRLYPAARVLAPNAKQRDALNRQKTMSRITTGDWDAVIVPQSFINMMPDDPVRESKYINDQIRELEAAKISAANEQGKKSPKAKDIQKAIDKLTDRLKELQTRATDNVQTFEQLGVDAMFVDEAHEYKKLQFATQMENIKGLDKSASKRAFSMYMKTRWVQEHNQGRNVTFATGTPISNTIAEAWTMMRFLRPDVLKAYHMERFDDFQTAFADTVTNQEMTPGGDFKPVTRFAQYVNTPELMAAWLTTADVVTPEKLNLPGLPALKNGRTTAVIVPQTPRITNYIQYLRQRLLDFAALSGLEKKLNSHIPLTTYTLARKASLDMRMIDASLPDEPGSKLNHVADRVAQIYNDSTPVKGAQMVFSDLYQDDPDNPRFNLYEELKKKFIERGIPEHEIVIVTNKHKGPAGEAMFAKLNAGQLRVAIGGTSRMGVGVNAQEHLIALHHLHPTDKPMDIEQRNGRIIRQGNSNPEVEVLSYGVAKTLDAAAYQKLAAKQKFTNQLIRGEITGRKFEDAANEMSLSFEEQMAAFSDDPRAIEKVGLAHEINQMETLQSGHAEQLRKARGTLADLQQRQIPKAEEDLKKAHGRVATLQAAFPNDADYHLSLKGEAFAGKKDVAAALDKHFKGEIESVAKEAKDKGLFGGVVAKLTDPVSLNGMPLNLKVKMGGDGKGILHKENATVEWSQPDMQLGGEVKTGGGFFTSLAANLERAQKDPEGAERYLASKHRDLRELQGFVKQPFEREGELEDARQRLAALEAELDAESKAKEQQQQQAPTAAPPPDEGADAEEEGRGGGEHGMAMAPYVPSAPANAFMKQVRSFRNAVAPQTVGEPARFVGDLIRQLNARMANEMQRADVALSKFRREFDRTRVPKKWQYDPTLPLPRNYAFIDAYEGGSTATLPPAEAQAALEFQKQNGELLTRVHALGTGALQTVYQNYFPHIWDDPKKAERVIAASLAKKPLEGSKSFMKQRTHQLFREGLEAGLKPVHDNPVDLWLLKKQEVEKYIMAHSLINETRDAGLLQFVHAFMRAPMGWTKANDKAFEVWGPPSVTIKEAFDAGLREKTLEVLNHLGVPHERLARIRGKRWGYEADTGLPGSERIVSKFGGPDFILWHELGHALDNRYRDMRDTLTGPLAERNQLASYQMRKQPVPAALQRTEALNKEIRALADLRYEGQTTTPGFKQYVRSAPEKMAVALQAYIHAPERMKQVAPTVHGALRAFLASHPELNEINDIRPSLRLGEGETQMSVGGFIKLGDYYMPDPAARVLNNYLSPGLNHHLAYRTLRQTSNLLNGAQLGLSAFHLGFTSVDAAVSRLAVAIEDLSHGNLGSAVKTALSVPMAPFTNIRLGAKLRAEALEGRPSWVDRNLLRLSPGAQGTQIAQLVKALEAGGGRIGQDAFWRSEFSRRMVRAFHEGTATGYIKGAAHAPFALLEQTMRPILEYTVPRQKLGVFADIARRELERLGPNAAPEDVRASMRNAWDSVDNRMGQVVYDNLFYNRAVKDLALLSFRAYGWQLGKYRELGGAAWDVAKQGYELAHGRTPQMTHRMAYAMALPILVGAMGALTKYMLTGQGPQDLSEYYMIPTGEVDSKGRKVKVNLPSFVKDVISTWKHPLTSFTHTLNPLASEVMDQYQNRDFYGRRLFNPDDPLPRQLLDRGLALGKEFTPFSVSGALRLADDAAPLHKQVLPFFGITPVPARNLMSPAETVLAEAMSERMQGVGMPKETFDRAKLVREVVDGLKSKDAGRQAEAVGKAYDGIRSGAMSPSSTYAMIQKVGMTPFQFQLTHADTETAMRAWRVATPEERQQMHDRLLMKIVGSRKLGPEQKGKLLQEIGLERN